MSDKPSCFTLSCRIFPGLKTCLQLQVAALEAAANPILISSRDGTIIWVNAAFEHLSGYLAGRRLSAKIPGC